MKSKYQLLIVLLVFGCFCSHLFSKHTDSGFWWQVEFKIVVSGQYNYQTNNIGFDGKYSFTTVLLGTLEEDEGDFIFLQAYQDIRGMKWKEVTHNENGRKEQNLVEKIKPEITLNYVFREKGDLSFDFDFQPVPLPYKSTIFPTPVKQLRLPESAAEESINSRAKYKKGIVNGSNRVVLADTAIYHKEKKEVNRVFKWKWQEKKKSWKSVHEVDVRLKIIRLVKK